MSSGLQDYRGANAAKDVVPGVFPELVTLAATGAGHTEVTGRPLEILPTRLAPAWERSSVPHI